MDGGTVSGNPTTYTIETTTFTLNRPTMNGYYFAGWTGSNGTNPELDVAIAKGTIGNKEYKAVWLFDVEIVLDGETATNNSRIIVNGSETKTSSFKLIKGNRYTLEAQANLTYKTESNEYQIVRMYVDGVNKTKQNSYALQRSYFENTLLSNVTLTKAISIKFEYINAYTTTLNLPNDTINNTELTTYENGKTIVAKVGASVRGETLTTSTYVIAENSPVELKVNSEPVNPENIKMFTGFIYKERGNDTTYVVGVNGETIKQYKFEESLGNYGEDNVYEIGTYYYNIKEGKELEEITIQVVQPILIELDTTVITTGNSITITDPLTNFNKVLTYGESKVALYTGDWVINLTDSNAWLKEISDSDKTSLVKALFKNVTINVKIESDKICINMSTT